jgi:hypothetical protein
MRDIKHKRYTKAEAFWKKAIEEYQEGTQSIKEFCQVRELREGTFYKWKKRLQLRKASVSSFIPLKIVDDKERHCQLKHKENFLGKFLTYFLNLGTMSLEGNLVP